MHSHVTAAMCGSPGLLQLTQFHIYVNGAGSFRICT